MTIQSKTIEFVEKREGQILEVSISGKLEKEDYEGFVPEVERLIEEHDKIRILFRMQEFRGWTAGALWEDLKFDLKHFNDIERVAFVGDSKWEQGMALFCKPFTTAEVRYFDQSRLEQAREWIKAE